VDFSPKAVELARELFSECCSGDKMNDDGKPKSYPVDLVVYVPL
jgi:hypothetical protein